MDSADALQYPPSMAAVPRFSLFILVLLTQGCLFLGGINVRPQARLESFDPGPFLRTERVTLSAADSFDEDGDDLAFVFKAQVCGVDTGGIERCGPVDPQYLIQRQDAAELTVPADIGEHPGVAVELVRVNVTVIDEVGAESEAGVVLAVTNLPPTLELQSQPLPGNAQNLDGSFPYDAFAAPVVIAARVGGDELNGVVDEVELVSWEVVQIPGGSNSEVYRLDPNPDDPENRFSRALYPDSPGVWTVRATVRDSLEGVTSADIDIFLAGDRAPCIELTSPTPGTAVAEIDDGLSLFEVLVVDDDLDPYSGGPAGRLSFDWSVSPTLGGDDFAQAGSDLPRLEFDPTLYDPGSIVRVRVEVVDREPTHAPNCPVNEPTCSMTPDLSCTSRETWEVEIL